MMFTGEVLRQFTDKQTQRKTSAHMA